MQAREVYLAIFALVGLGLAAACAKIPASSAPLSLGQSKDEVPLIDPNHFCGGKGTTADPARVCTPLHLSNVRKYSSNPSTHFQLSNDIDLKGIEFSPIDTLHGSFDGGKHKISNWLFSGMQDFHDAALFGTVAKSGVVRNLTIADSEIREDGGGRYLISRAAFITARLEGKVENCHVDKGRIHRPDGSNTALLVSDIVQGTVERSTVRGTIVSRGYAGGIAVTMTGGSIRESMAMVTIHAVRAKDGVSGTSSEMVGGLVAYATEGVVEDVAVNAALSGFHDMGGLFGRYNFSTQFEPKSKLRIRNAVVEVLLSSSGLIKYELPENIGGIIGAVRSDGANFRPDDRLLDEVVGDVRIDPSWAKDPRPVAQPEENIALGFCVGSETQKFRGERLALRSPHWNTLRVFLGKDTASKVEFRSVETYAPEKRVPLEKWNLGIWDLNPRFPRLKKISF